MGVFKNEGEMQTWLSSELSKNSGLGEMIEGIDRLDSVTAKNMGEIRLLSTFRACANSLFQTKTLFENENISLNKPDILKPDFVLYAAETESIVIVELKNLVSPSRQAGTELGAYTAEIRTCIPFLSDGDVIHVLISQEWPVLLKHYARHEIFWQGRKLLCLRPMRKPDNSIALEIVPLNELAEDYSSFQIGKGHLGGFNISLYDDNLYKNNADPQRLTSAVEVFKVALQAMAVSGNRLGSHGFAFLWKDKSQQSLAPYSIIVANFAPFKSLERYVRNGDVPNIIERFIEVVTEFCPEGHGNTLTEISNTCRDIVSHVCTPRPEVFATWDVLSESLKNRMEHVAFVGWGMFGEAAVEEVKIRHQAGDLACSLESPIIGLEVLAKLIDEKYEVLDLSYYLYDPDDETN